MKEPYAHVQVKIPYSLLDEFMGTNEKLMDDNSLIQLLRECDIIPDETCEITVIRLTSPADSE